MTTTNYLDLAGLQRFKTKLDTQYAGIYRTETQVNNQIEAKLATYSQNYVQIVSDVPTIAGGAVEGIIYLVPDSNAASGTFAYVAYAVESISGTPTVVRIGAGTTVLPTVDQTVIEESTNAVAGGAVFGELALKVNLSDVTGSVTQNDTNPVTSGGVYTALQNYVTTASIASSVTSGDTNVVSGDAVYNHVATVVDDYVEESRVTSSAPSSASTDICTSGAMYTALGLKVNESRVTSSAPSDDSTDICTSGSVYTALGLKVNTSSIVDSITDGNMNPVTSNAVYDALAEIQKVSNPEIDVMFMPSTEIWIDSTGWSTMKAKYETSGEFVALTKNSSGYYVIVPGDVASVDTLVLATSDDSISTGVLTDVTSASDLNGLVGKIVAAEDEATSLTILA